MQKILTIQLENESNKTKIDIWLSKNAASKDNEFIYYRKNYLLTFNAVFKISIELLKDSKVISHFNGRLQGNFSINFKEIVSVKYIVGKEKITELFEKPSINEFKNVIKITGLKLKVVNK